MAKLKDVKQNFEPVTMELGGRERTFQFDMNAFAELEKRFGTIDAAMTQLTEGKMTDIKIILWAALAHDEVAEFDEDTGEPVKYKVTPYDVGSWIKNPKMLQEASAKLGQAISAGMPDMDELPEEVLAEMEKKGLVEKPAKGKNVKKAQ